MTSAEEKIREAAYFLERTKENSRDRDHYRWNLSAFLSACESVREYLRADNAKKTGFKKWWEKKHKTLEDEKVSKYLREQRNQVVHVRPLRPSGTFSYETALDIKVSDGDTIFILPGTDTTVKKISIGSGCKFPVSDSQTAGQCLWYFDDFSDEDIVTLCVKYLARLEQLIADCALQFP